MCRRWEAVVASATGMDTNWSFLRHSANRGVTVRREGS